MIPDGLGAALEELYRRVPRGMSLGLAPMQAACAKAGNPESAFAVVHVAGTNGKGSVCAMVEAAARAAGRRTGLYTSPHLCRFAERIQVAGEPLPDAALAAALGEALALGPDLTFFEAATLAAFLAFRRAGVELAVLEVGLGGRLDATNVVPAPAVGAITRIALDHMDILGPTLPAIAREKAGIAKAGMPLVVGALDADVEEAIVAVAAAAGARVERATEDAAAQTLVAAAPLGLAGAHQRENALVAAAVGLRLGLASDAVAAGLAGARWPGRLETLHTAEGEYLLDAAHNPDGVAALLDHVGPGSERPEALVFGALADKAWAAMLDALAPRFPTRVYASPRGRAPADPAQLAARHDGTPCPSVATALSEARRRVGQGGRVVVCGSIYLVGEARAQLLGLPEDPPVAL